MTQSLLIRLMKTSRPFFWVILPLAYLTGLSYSENGLSHPEFRFTPIMIFQMIFLSFPFCIFTFGLNDLHDIASDGVNARKLKTKGIALLSEGTVLQNLSPSVIYLGALLTAIGMVSLSILTSNRMNLFYTLSLLVLSFTYSTPPWRLKTRAPLDAITGGIIACLCPAAMGYTLTDTNGLLPPQLYLLTFAAMGFHAFSTIMDEEPDRAAGDPTFAVRFGKRPAALISAAAILLLDLSLNNRFFQFFAGFCGVLIFYVALFPSAKVARRIYLIIFGMGVILSLVWLIPFFL